MNRKALQNAMWMSLLRFHGGKGKGKGKGGKNSGGQSSWNNVQKPVFDKYGGKGNKGKGKGKGSGDKNKGYKGRW